MEWFFGHWHADFDFELPYINAHCVYDLVHKIDKNGKRISAALSATTPSLYVGFEC